MRMLLIEDVPGLGRAIADTIARGAGAWLTLQSPANGRPDGFEATLKLVSR